MRKFVSKLKGEIYDEPLLSIFLLVSLFVLLFFVLLVSFDILVKDFMILNCDVPTLKIL